ncbi:MAG: transcriptional regulator [Phycisphaerae bacterium]|nr:transcriptional regulator [Phycisphaerae bacterium]
MPRSPTDSTPATVTPPAVDLELAASQDRFIALWGEMASRWGVPRTVAETHALLFVHSEPLDVESIMQRLRISRGNASMTLRTLVEWGIISRQMQRGERREFFRAEQDVWRLFATVARARKRREIDPLLEGLVGCRVASTGRGREGTQRSTHNDRMDELLSAVRLLDGVSERFTAADGRGLRTAAVALAKLVGFIVPAQKRAERSGIRGGGT